MPCAAAAAVAAADAGGIAANKAPSKAAHAHQKAIDANAYQGQIALDQFDGNKTTFLIDRQPLAHGAPRFALLTQWLGKTINTA